MSAAHFYKNLLSKFINTYGFIFCTKNRVFLPSYII